MKRFILLAALALSACASIQNPVNYNELYGIEAAYGIALSAAVGYRHLPLCHRGQVSTYANICAQRSVILQLQAADRRAEVAIAQANAFVEQNPTVNAVSVIQLANSAVNAFSQLEAQNNIH